MKNLMILSICILMSFIFNLTTAIAGDVGNGAGSVETNFSRAYENAKKYITKVLIGYYKGDFAGEISIEDIELLVRIQSSMDEEYKANEKLVFLKGHSDEFITETNERPRVAKTNDPKYGPEGVGSPILLNSDIFNESMDYKFTVTTVIHELGHHHKVSDHLRLDRLGNIVAEYAIEDIIAFSPATVKFKRPVSKHGSFLLHSPYCYKGTASRMGSTLTYPVYLVLAPWEALRGPQESSYYLVNQFNIGPYNMLSSGREQKQNELKFNENNDHIPGGEATFNFDILLQFHENGASGKYSYIKYPEGGYGGGDDYESNADIPKELVEEGELTLQPCKIIDVDLIE